MNTKYILLVIALLILISCNRKTKYEYYDSGELKYEEHFLSNQNDRNYITSEEGQNQIAQTILNFVSDLK